MGDGSDSGLDLKDPSHPQSGIYILCHDRTIHHNPNLDS